jgi:hypothetical protein
MDVVTGTKGLTALTPKVDYDQTVIGLPLVTTSVFLTAKVKRG